MSAVRLRKLAQDATPGPWQCVPLEDRSLFEIVQALNDHCYIVQVDGMDEPNARLIALAPSLAVLVADMADALDDIAHARWGDNTERRVQELLIRVDALSTGTDT